MTDDIKYEVIVHYSESDWLRLFDTEREARDYILSLNHNTNWKLVRLETIDRGTVDKRTS